MKTRFLISISVMVALLGLASCQTAATSPATAAMQPTEAASIPTEAPAMTAQPSGGGSGEASLKVAFVFPGLTNDGGFNSLGYKGMQQAEQQLGVDAAYVENIQVPDAAKVLRDYANQGYEVVFAYSGTFVNAVQDVAPDYPNITFVVQGGAGDKFSDNVWVIGNDFEDAFFLTGAVAGLMSKTGTIGYIGAIQIPIYVSSGLAYEAGAKYVNPDTKTITSWTNDFNDAVAAKQAAIGQIQSGADVIQSGLDLGVLGLLQAAKENQGVWIQTDMQSQCDNGPNTSLVSAVMDYPGMVVKIVQSVENGEKGGYLPTSVTAGTVHLAYCGSNVPSDVQQKITEIQKGVVAGTIDYPTQADLK